MLVWLLELGIISFLIINLIPAGITLLLAINYRRSYRWPLFGFFIPLFIYLYDPILGAFALFFISFPTPVLLYALQDHPELAAEKVA